MRHRDKGQTAVVMAVVVFVFIVVGYLLASLLLGYWLEPVSSTQVAIQFDGNQPKRVVGPGIYTDLAPFADIQKIETRDLPFTVSDPEVLTKDQQRIGVTASGTIRRPGLDRSDFLITNWGRYSTFYRDDASLVGAPAKDKEPEKFGLAQALGNQAIKVCVGDLEFSKAVIGSARDVLRECIDKEFNDLAIGYGLTVSNIVVPNVTLSPDVQKAMDNITNQRFAQQVAVQGELTAKAQADQELAKQAGAIRVEQGKVQEQARQDAATAALDQQKLQAQRAVIEQQKANDLYSATQDLEIQRAKNAAAQEAAKAGQANEAALAAIYQSNPAYANQKAIEAQASAWKATDKVIVPEGTQPVMVIGNGTQPVVQTGGR